MAQAKKKTTKPTPAKQAKTTHEVVEEEAETETEPDELLALGLELKRLTDRHEHLEEKNHGQPVGTERTYREMEMEDLGDRIDAVREYICAIQAVSPAGALVQLNAATAAVDMVRGLSSEEAAPHLRRLRRLLYSAGTVLEAQFGKPPGLDSISDYLDPWTAYEIHFACIQGTTMRRL